MVSDKPKEALSSSECKHVLPRLLQLQFVKAAVSVNPCVVSLTNVSVCAIKFVLYFFLN